MRLAALVLTLLSLALATRWANACSRVLWKTADGQVITGRSLDWTLRYDLNVWAFPAGLERDGGAGDRSIRWKSRYGSVVATAYDGLVADGMNEKGLVANLLYLAGAGYPQPDGMKPLMNIAAWVQWTLDRHATVAEVVNAMEGEPFQPVAARIPGDLPIPVHLSVSDASGDSAILEYLGGKLTIHHGPQFRVMTNEPSYDEQLALDAYWKSIGDATLPGTSRPADRFVRASYWLRNAPERPDERTAIATMFSIMRNVSVPFSATSDPHSPNVAPTWTRTVADQGRRIYYVEQTDMPNVFWIDFARLGLEPGTPVLKLVVEQGPYRAGEVSGEFKPSDRPFTFLPAREREEIP